MDLELVRSKFRTVMSAVPAPVAVVTAMHDGSPAGATITAFASLSMNPPMLLLALGQGSTTLATIQHSGRFGVNLLATGQVELSDLFATNKADKFAHAEWRVESGVPRLEGVPGWVVCAVSSIIQSGDHALIVGNVLDADDVDAERLLYYRRGYARPQRLDARP